MFQAHVFTQRISPWEALAANLADMWLQARVGIEVVVKGGRPSAVKITQ